MDYNSIYSTTEITSPLGKITLISSERGLSRLLFNPIDVFTANLKAPSIPLFKAVKAEESKAAQQLIEYFEGKRKIFTIPLDISGTPFRMKVWEALLTISYGKTLSYCEIANQIGSPKSSRAVGQACGANPVPIIVPCHRVLTSTGKIGGYTGGTHIKNALLKLEGIDLS